MTYFILIDLFIVYFFLKKNKILAKKLNLIDLPSSIKKHKQATPITGGILILIGLSLNYFYINFFSPTINFYSFPLVITIFLIGLLDDIISLKPYQKLFLTFLPIFFFILITNDLRIVSLNFDFGFFYFPTNLFINFFLPILGLLLLINAYNMSDGVNGLAASIGLSWIIYLIVKYPFLFDSIFLVILNLNIFIFFNFKKKIFLGDSGNYILSTLIGTTIISINFNKPYLFITEEIFLLLIFPGIDMLRLFIVRIINKKNPFSGDLNHLHHLLYRKIDNNYLLVVIYILIINFPIYLFFFYKINIYYLIILQFITYFFLLKISSKNNTGQFKK